MRKKILLGSILIIGIVLVSITFFINGRQSLSIDELYFDHVSLSNNELAIRGGIMSSGVSYRNHRYDITENEIQITIYGGVVTERYPSGNFEFTIDGSALEVVDVIYLKHKDDLIQIYHD